VNKFDVNYFIKKFEAIPEELWAINSFQDELGRYCALGHCGYGLNAETSEGATLNKLLGWVTIAINDGRHKKYPQPTPKQRILAALHDIKEKNNV